MKRTLTLMAKITCAISGIRFECSYLNTLEIEHTAGYYHPIFAAPYSTLYKLYTAHTKGYLKPADSYLLFLAYLHSSGQVEWGYPLTLDPKSASTKQLVENNIRQLIAVLEKTATVQLSSFSQPSFVTSYDNCRLETVHNWIEAWEENLSDFKNNRADMIEIEALSKIERKLGKLILSGEPPEGYSKTIAHWANKAATFPYDKEEEYIAAITSCFNTNKMFNTPLATLKEIKDYCECNIAAGSIHFHTLMLVLKEGIFRHHDYLGGSILSLGYEVLPSLASLEDKQELAAKQEKAAATLEAIRNSASTAAPVATDYPDSLSYLRARLAYRSSKGSTPMEEHKL